MTENILKVLEFTADRAQAIAGAQSVVGEPIVIGDVTVVPISAVDCGFAGGLGVGQKVRLEGRFQSREYEKALQDGRREARRAYEISAGGIYQIL